MVPAGVRKQAGTREIVRYVLSDLGRRQLAAGERFPKKQAAILAELQRSDDPVDVPTLTTAADCGTAPLKALAEKELIQAVRRRELTFDDDPVPDAEIEPDLPLSDDQQRALDRVVASLETGEHQTLLLHGVTGSGKTEVYMRAIREAVSYGRQAIVLVPEIALTPQTIRRFRGRFGRVAVLHSHLTDSERHRQWQQIASGQVEVVVGARSAIFAPVPQLGLVVIDEEHETTFKQSSTPRYHAREVARERARQARVPLLLGSATPTLESVKAARDDGDIYLSLPRRVSNRPLPPVSIVDTRDDPYLRKGHSIGRALQNAVKTALADGGQVILFLNLRGYSPVLWCPQCSAGLECPHCTTTLTWHKDREQVLCHSCDYAGDLPERCGRCQDAVPRLIGTGTQRLEKEVGHKFPGARIARMDSDSMRQAGSHDRTLSAFGRGELDILLGTQMIAKGLDFPNVTLVGVIDADMMLNQPDLRAAERTFHLISQVAGRTGRGDRGGRVLVQTLAPDEPVIQLAAAHDFKRFAQLELGSRRAAAAPPFAALARVVVRGPDESAALAEARRIAEVLREAADEGVRVLGPAPAPLVRLRDFYRFHLQLTAPTTDDLLALWRQVDAAVQPPDPIELTIDVDPLDMR